MDQLYGTLSGGEQLDGVLTIPKTVGELGEKTITENGTYDASDDGYDGYSRVVASVPNTYTAGDEGKVVDNGALVSQTSATYTINNTYDTTLINSVTVNVSGGSTPTLETVTKTYTPTTSQQTETITPSSGYDGIAEVDVTVNAMPTGTEGTPTATKGAVSNHAVQVTPSVTNQAGYIAGGTKTGTAVTVSASELVSGTKSITANGTNQDVVGYAAVDVAVPNSYSQSDEGKVVSSGALVAQTAHADVTPTTSDQTIDTTLNNSLKVKGDADLIAGNIKKDVVLFGVTGSYEGSGGSDETGSFVASSSQSNVTISVTALHSHVLLWDSVVKSDDDISSAPYGTKKTLLTFADNNTGFVIYGGINTNGTGYIGQFSGIGRWGGNTQWNDRVEFTSSTIKIINPRISGTAYPWIDGHTINWRAW